MSGHEDKGKRYIGLLDSARTNGSWTELPELIRKVTKHAPQQTILIQTATAEHYIVTRATRPIPSTASDSPIANLRQTIQGAQSTPPEETFQGQTCLAWASWTGASPNPSDPIHTPDVIPLFDRYGQKDTSTWTKICLAKAVFIQGKRLSQQNEDIQATAVYRAAAAWIDLNSWLVKLTPQLSYWAEQILASYSTCESCAISPDERLKTMRAWSSMTAKTQEVAPSTFGNTGSHVPRSTVYKIYYDTLSATLAHSHLSSSTARSQQASELRAVESSYETVFLRNRKFPNATESNAPVEEWVEQVIRNWKILCSSSRQEQDLGEGGRNALTRNVLDVLYRAAMKTFHSTLILRRLFQVHKSLTEFDLAYRCLDTYIELSERGRTRAAKAGEVSHESEEVMLLVVSEGIEGLCSYGRQKEARKAFDLATKLEDWLDEIMPEEEETLTNGHSGPVEHVNGHPPEPISEPALQSVHRAVGIAKAHWARWTPFSETRTELQADALTALHKATTMSKPELSTLYALALLCAETREISQAIRWTKVALQQISVADAGSGTTTKDRCAFWHLMTLLLSSQQDFETALHSSAATLETIPVTSLNPLYGSTEPRNGSVVKPTNGLEAHSGDDFECDDLQRLAELQISYLALVELTDGPETALNHSGELLSLYSTSFRQFEANDIKQTPERTLVPPKTSTGTTKSMRGSIFSRKKAGPSVAPSLAPSSTSVSLHSTANTEKSARPATQAGQAPIIQVTDETGKAPTKKHLHAHLVHRHHDHNPASTRLPKGTRPATVARAVSDIPELSEPAPVSLNGTDTSITSTDVVDHAEPTGTQHDQHVDAKQALGSVPHNITSHEKAPAPLGHANQSLEQDIRLPSVHSNTTSTAPAPQFPKATAQKHALVVLNKIWLIVATLYRRSHMFEEAMEAVEEASKAAVRIETIVSAVDLSARVLADAGWGGGGKSSDEVWADVHCSRAELLYATARRREEEGIPITSDNMREVVEQYEHCLMYFPDHHGGVVGLSNILLDFYEKKINLAKKVDDGRSFGIRPAQKQVREEDVLGAATPSQEHVVDPFSSQTAPGDDLRKTPENLNRIAARDRAYGLLNTLTKLGTGWDSSEAWFALARAHELGGEIDKAKQILWWCIELEDTRPIRHWRNLGCSGYVL